MVNYNLLIELHKDNPRQGPGGVVETKLALLLAGLMDHTPECLQVADIGCGTGASTITLAECLNAEIIAVDLFQDFLDILITNSHERGVANKISTIVSSMEQLPFKDKSLDLIWAEGSIYNMGFENGVGYFKRFLKPGGILAVTEITWLTKDRPEKLQTHWNKEYPEIAVASKKISILEEHGFTLQGYFPLPKSCWLQNYYIPLENRFDSFIAKHDFDDARTIIEAEKKELNLYKKYSAYYSYGFYIARMLQ